MSNRILTLNAGSSSIKFSLFELAVVDGQGELLVHGQVEGLGSSPRFLAQSACGATLAEQSFARQELPDHHAALIPILDLVETRFPDRPVAAVGHRVVHGGPHFAAPALIEDDVLAALHELEPLAPLHQPHNLAGIAAARAAFPQAAQIACFDTAFHRSHPWVSDTFALPRSFYDEGVRRYGFHGLSYEYVTGELADIAPHHAAGRVVIAHLGNGASMCATQGGQSVGSSMGFTALDGLPMGTRCGQLDPGVVLYLMQSRGMTVGEISDLLYKSSGLKGLSELSHDMRELESTATPKALQAIEYFVFRIRRELGALTAILSGLDALVFCGGIGEHAWRVRERVCQGFEWLGIELDETSNRDGTTVISSQRSRVRVFVIPTNEELMIARHARRLLG